MIPVELFYGIVEDNNDPLEKGRLKIRLLPEMEEASSDHLPWLEPFFGGQNTKTTAYIKESYDIGAPLWCFFYSSSFTRGWYITGVFLETPFNFDSIKSDLSSIAEDEVGEASNISFSRYRNGTVEFKDNSSGYMGVYHASGSYAIFDSNGGIVAYSKSNIKMYTDDNMIELKDTAGIVINSGAGTITFNGSGNTLVKYSELSRILSAITSNMDARILSDPISGVCGPVLPPFTIATYAPTLTTDKINMNADKLETS